MCGDLMRWKDYEPRKCVVCGKTYKPCVSFQKKCRACSIHVFRKNHYCLYCKKCLGKQRPFEPVQAKLFCSTDCFNGYLDIQREIRRRFSLSQIPEELTELKEQGQDYAHNSNQSTA
jgi:hypothetical protein